MNESVFDKTKFILLFLIILSIITLDFNVGIINSDLLIIGPSVEKILDNSYYANDPVISLHKDIYPNGFKYLIAFFTIFITDQQLVNLFLAIIFKIFFILMAYKLLFVLLKNKREAFLGAAISTLTFHGIPGWQFGFAQLVGQILVDSFFPLIFYLVIKFMRNNKLYHMYILFFLAGVLFYIHPISIPPILLFLFLAYFIYKKSFKHFFFGVFLFLILISPALIQSKSATFYEKDAIYFNILEKRVSETKFPELSFGTYKIIFIFIIGILGFYFKKDKQIEDKLILCWSLFLVAIFFILSILMQYYKVLYSIEPTRYPRFIVFFMFLYLVPLLKRLKKITFMLPIALILILFIISWQFSHIFLVAPGINGLFCSSFGYPKDFWSCKSYQEKITYPVETKDVCTFLLNNTQKDDIIIVPPGGGEKYRFCSKRAIFTSWKDGGISVLSREAAINWLNRYNLANDAYFNSSIKKFREIKKLYNATYVVTEDSQELNFTQLFKANNSYVYLIN